MDSVITIYGHINAFHGNMRKFDALTQKLLHIHETDSPVLLITCLDDHPDIYFFSI